MPSGGVHPITHGALWAWDFERNGRELKVRVEGQIVLNDTFEILDAALDGFGLAYVPEDLAEPHLKSGRLKRVLDEWCPPWPGCISIIQAAANPPRPLLSSSKRCACVRQGRCVKGDFLKRKNALCIWPRSGH